MLTRADSRSRLSIVFSLMLLLAAAPAVFGQGDAVGSEEAAPADEGPGWTGCGGGCCCCRAGGKGMGPGRGHGGGRHGRRGPGRGMGPGGGMGPGPGHGGGGPHRAEMATYRKLLDNHERIERTVEEIPGGVRTVTTTEDPDLVPALREHLAQMTELLESGGSIRNWDPLFVALFDHSESIRMEVAEVEGGVAVTETSDDPEVAQLIRAHAQKVNEFVARGQEAYDEPTELPEGYEARGGQVGRGPERGMGRGCGCGRMRGREAAGETTATEGR